MKNRSGQDIFNSEQLLLKKLIELKDKLSLTFKDYNTIRKEICPHWPSEHFFRQAIEKLNKGVSIGRLSETDMVAMLIVRKK